MSAKIRYSDDGRTLVAVTLWRTDPPDNDESTGYTIEVIYHMHWPNDFTLATNPIVLRLLSTTRRDTREPVNLTLDEETYAMNEAVVAADQHDRELTGG